MLNKIKNVLGLNPKIRKEGNNSVQIGVSVQKNKMVITFDHPVNMVTLDKGQLTNLLAALASGAGLLK